MAKITRFTVKPFGGSGPSGDFGQFGSLAAGAANYTKDPATIQALDAFLTGWAAETLANNRPALEDINSLDFLTFQALCYFAQSGMPEYDSGTTYYINSMCQVAGVIYKSLTDANINNEPTVSPTHWTLLITPQVGLGAWVDKTSSYGAQKATTDGFVVARLQGSLIVYIYSDANADPTTARCWQYSAVGSESSLMCPIKKDDYWKLTVSGAAPTSVYFIPLGA
jgi:hypothetical protein